MTSRKEREYKSRHIGGEGPDFFEHLHDILLYSEEERGLIRLSTNKRAGYVGKIGYRFVGVRSKPYYEHRLVWAMHHGKFPDKFIDHINRDKTDNRIENLREVCQTQNMWNTEKPLSKYSGRRGVTWCKRRKKWKAQIRVFGKQVNLGNFDCPELAEFVYSLAKERYHRYN